MGENDGGGGGGGGVFNDACGGTETQTDEKQMTKFSKFCNRRGINPNLIMLKITLFVMYGGRYLIII